MKLNICCVPPLLLSLLAGTAHAVPQQAPPPAPPSAAAEAAPPVTPSTLQPVPHPDLDPYEDAVADQLRGMREDLERVLATPGSTRRDRANAYGEMGRLYHAYGLTRAAEASYTNARLLDPEAAPWPYYAGMLLRDAGRLEEAARLLARARDLAPTYPATRVHLGRLQLALGDLDAAEESLVEAERIDPAAGPAARAARGQVALSRQDYLAAVEHLTAALAAVPEANRLYTPLALAYRELGAEDTAREQLAQSGTVGIQPPDPWMEELEELKQGERVHVIRGRMAYQAGDHPAAVHHFRQAVEANPESTPARINLASALAQVGDQEGAIAQLREVVEQEPEQITARFNLGVLLAGRGEEAAGEHLEKVVELAPHDSRGHFELARWLIARGRTGESLPHWRAAVEAQPAFEEARLGEVQALLELEDWARARLRLEEAHDLLPESGLVARLLARLLATCPDPSLRDGARASQLAGQVLEAQQSVDHVVLLALALAEAGRCDEAAQWQQKAVEAARELGAQQLVDQLEGPLERYQQGPPCRPPVPSPGVDDLIGEAGS